MLARLSLEALPGRSRGRRAKSVNGQLVYAVGDIHGRYDLLKDILAILARDIRDRARGRRPIIVFCGDYIDRGPQSAEVLEALIWLRRRDELEVLALKGNHEQALLDFVEDPPSGAAWLKYGGAETVLSYGVARSLIERPDLDYGRLRDVFLDKLPASHLRQMQTLELMLQVGDYAFVHAGVRPATSLAHQVEEDLLWIRRDFIEAAGPFEKIIVHGHTWTSDQPQMLPHRIGVDTGAYETGVLTAIRLEDGRAHVLQARRLQSAANQA